MQKLFPYLQVPRFIQGVIASIFVIFLSKVIVIQTGKRSVWSDLRSVRQISPDLSTPVILIEVILIQRHSLAKQRKETNMAAIYVVQKGIKHSRIVT